MSSSEQNTLARNAAELVHNGRWPLFDVAQDDWYFAEDLLVSLALLGEPGAYERGVAAMERVAQQYQRWLVWTSK